MKQNKVCLSVGPSVDRLAFLDASTHLYKRVCPTVSILWSVRLSRVFFKSRKLENLTNLTKSDKSLSAIQFYSLPLDASLFERTCSPNLFFFVVTWSLVMKKWICRLSSSLAYQRKLRTVSLLGSTWRSLLTSKDVTFSFILECVCLPSFLFLSVHLSVCLSVSH